jgi:hypothetical protein
MSLLDMARTIISSIRESATRCDEIDELHEISHPAQAVETPADRLLAAYRLFDDTDERVAKLLPPGPLRRHPALLAAVAAVPDLASGDLAVPHASCERVVKMAEHLNRSCT